MKWRRLDRATLQGIELEYQVRGASDPMVLVSAGCCADWFEPLLEESGSLRAPVISRGYALLALGGPYGSFSCIWGGGSGSGDLASVVGLAGLLQRARGSRG